MRLSFLLLISFIMNIGLRAQSAEPLGIAMEGYKYPYPVSYLSLNIEGQDVRMAYMDVPPATAAPEKPNNQTVVLFHGKNFFGVYWQKTIQALSAAGYRVVVPDQIGFGKSSKPNIHYSFHLLSEHTKQLLDTLGVEQIHLVGHSMGGMLAVRFALMYPQTVTKLILENPIGLEDYRRKVPYRSVRDQYENILNYTLKSIRSYHETYYADWKPAYDEYVQVHYRWTLSGEYPRLAWASALTFEMIYTQPIVYELPQLTMPTLLVIGQEDRTTLGRGIVSEEILQTLGQYPELGEEADFTIPQSTLVELEGVGHIPHLEAANQFHATLINFLN